MGHAPHIPGMYCYTVLKQLEKETLVVQLESPPGVVVCHMSPIKDGAAQHIERENNQMFGVTDTPQCYACPSACTRACAVSIRSLSKIPHSIYINTQVQREKNVYMKRFPLLPRQLI